MHVRNLTIGMITVSCASFWLVTCLSAENCTCLKTVSAFAAGYTPGIAFMVGMSMSPSSICTANLGWDQRGVLE